MNLSSLMMLFFQSAVIVLIAPLILGMIRRVKARFQNRRGAPVSQPYWALASLLHKEMTVPEHSSWVFRFVPYAVLGTTLLLALVVPSLGQGAWPAAVSNIFFIAALAALSSVFLVFGGMDTGSTFGNMGANREMTLVALAEPALFVVLATLAFFAGSANLDGIVAFFAATPWEVSMFRLLPTLIALFLVVLAENARYPVDNPATHLELTMVHEAMVLEYSGPYLAMLEYASALRLTAFGALFMNIVFPFGIAVAGAGILALLVSALVLVSKLAIFAFLIGSIESLLVKMRFYRMQEYFTLTFLIALAGAVLAFAHAF